MNIFTVVSTYSGGPAFSITLGGKDALKKVEQIGSLLHDELISMANSKNLEYGEIRELADGLEEFEKTLKEFRLMQMAD